MFAPDLTLPALSHMKARFGDRLYGRYGFADAFHPTANWIGPDVIGIDLGITLLSAENLRTGKVWRWFMANPEITTAMQRAGFTPADSPTAAAPIRNDRAVYELVAAPPEAELRAARAARGALPASLADRFEAKTFTAPNGVTLPYRLLPPATAPPPGTRVPLVLVLHGSGEIGTGNRAQLTPLALAWARDEARARDGAFVVVPQMPGESVAYSGPVTRRRTHVRRHGPGARDARAPRLARGHAADRSAAHLGRRLLDGRVDGLEPAARAAGLLLRRRADRRGAARRSGDDGGRRRRGSG